MLKELAAPSLTFAILIFLAAWVPLLDAIWTRLNATSARLARLRNVFGLGALNEEVPIVSAGRGGRETAA